MTIICYGTDEIAYRPQIETEVGLYESPACERKFFVDATQTTMSDNHMTTLFLSKSMDIKPRNFYDAEASIVISELYCHYCYDAEGCSSCKRMGNPASFVELEEDKD